LAASPMEAEGSIAMICAVIRSLARMIFSF
jgi:hypothetical protein